MYTTKHSVFDDKKVSLIFKRYNYFIMAYFTTGSNLPRWGLPHDTHKPVPLKRKRIDGFKLNNFH